MVYIDFYLQSRQLHPLGLHLTFSPQLHVASMNSHQYTCNKICFSSTSWYNKLWSLVVPHANYHPYTVDINIHKQCILYLHPKIHKYIQLAYIHTYIHTHMYIHAHIHIHIHTHILAYMRGYRISSNRPRAVYSFQAYKPCTD